MAMTSPGPIILLNNTDSWPQAEASKLPEPLRSDWDSPGQVAIAALLVFLLSPLILCTNSLLLLSIYRFKRLRTPSNLFLLSLFSADFGIGLLLPVGLYFEFSRSAIRCPALCVFPYCILTQLSGVGMLSSAAVALDRCTSLALPLTYNNLITHRTASRTVAFIWTYSFAVASAPMLFLCLLPPSRAFCSFRMVSVPARAILVCSLYLPCLLVMVSSYCYVYVVARRHARAIYSVEGSLPPEIHRHYGWTLAITVGCFVLLWTPVTVYTVADSVTLNAFGGNTSFYLGLAGLSSSSVNPLLYGFRNTEFRIALLRMLKELLPRMSRDILGGSSAGLRRSQYGTASTLRPGCASTTAAPLETECSACTRTVVMMDLRPVSYV
ncbi:adenosine receptor A2b-like [Ornithodoros turicata]|uniref:adenosine receptor A2b-like n=1 Tax=Ornithodoros turicata TaxID=34597 RepID=UPI0031396D09